MICTLPSHHRQSASDPPHAAARHRFENHDGLSLLDKTHERSWRTKIKQSKKHPELKKVYDKVIPAIKQVIFLLSQENSVESAWSAAWSAESAARSAAWSAESTAESAWSAWSVTHSANKPYCSRIAKILLRLLKEAK